MPLWFALIYCLVVILLVGWHWHWTNKQIAEMDKMVRQFKKDCDRIVEGKK